MAYDFLTTFQSFRTILCICPHCNEIHRLSDLHLKYAGKAKSTWLDAIEAKNAALDEKEANFEEKEQKLRDAATERGRKKVNVEVMKTMAPSLARFKFNPYDIKLITHPVDYVVFDGMNDDKLNEIVLLASAVKTQSLAPLRRQIKDAVDAKNTNGKSLDL